MVKILIFYDSINHRQICHVVPVNYVDKLLKNILSENLLLIYSSDCTDIFLHLNGDSILN